MTLMILYTPVDTNDTGDTHGPDDTKDTDYSNEIMTLGTLLIGITLTIKNLKNTDTSESIDNIDHNDIMIGKNNGI